MKEIYIYRDKEREGDRGRECDRERGGVTQRTRDRTGAAKRQTETDTARKRQTEKKERGQKARVRTRRRGPDNSYYKQF